MCSLSDGAITIVHESDLESHLSDLWKAQLFPQLGPCDTLRYVKSRQVLHKWTSEKITNVDRLQKSHEKVCNRQMILKATKGHQKLG